MAQLLKIKVKDPSKWTKRCMLDNCGSMIRQNRTILHDGGKMSWHIIIIEMYVGLNDKVKFKLVFCFEHNQRGKLM